MAKIFLLTIGNKYNISGRLAMFNLLSKPLMITYVSEQPQCQVSYDNGNFENWQKMED